MRASVWCALLSSASAATVSNVHLPRDTAGNLLKTGEAHVLQYGGAYYFYFNNWGGCPGINCCNTSAGCASCCFRSKPFTDPCVYTTNHSVVVYRTTDLETWEYQGVALPLASRPPSEIEFRPCVVYNNYTQQFLMWFEARSSSDGGSHYDIAASQTPEGPFHTIATDVGMVGTGRVGDYNIFVDDDEYQTAYHVRTGFVVEQLSRNYTASTGVFSTFATPKPSEAPIMFKRDGLYYVIAGTGCCACRGGSTVYLLVAEDPLGPYEYLGDFASNQTQPFDPHSPYNYVTRSQPTATFVYNNKQVFLGNQWVTATELGRPRNHDLLFWAELQFTSNGNLTQLQWHDQVVL
eukprot:TRINITY_DN12038_c0_g2_i1.p1 TRINITY_DN12038_c0_g2~~TRINITY_DN12038_c0_g2_i1.p1  ORF type:complete len:349 (+),score=52.09 TRINITY_DN12038_c0_g2_i1:135-1181(+)